MILRGLFGRRHFEQDSYLSLVSFAGLFILSAPPIHAQEDPPIGRHYANPITLIPPVSEDAGGVSQPEVFEINGDGKDDVAFSMINEDNMIDPAPLYILTSNEAGSMENSTHVLIEGAVPITDQGFRQIIPADFNGDGRLDLFLDSAGSEPDCAPTRLCWTGGQNSLLLSDNDGKLTDVTTTHLPQLSDFSHGSSVADFDGDGDVDIWVSNLTGSLHEEQVRHPRYSYLMFNDGTGKFTIVADFSGLGPDAIVGHNGRLPDDLRLYSFWSTALDADGDGDNDIFLGLSTDVDACPEIQCRVNEQLNVNTILINDGSGHFATTQFDHTPSSEFGNGWIQHSLIYDLNGDGLDDQLLHQSRLDLTQPGIQIFISNGDGTFRDESEERYPGGRSEVLSDFQLHDLDGDGHKDLFSNVNWEKIDIRINDGEGYFRRLADDWVRFNTSDWVVLDVDGDGGTDFLAKIQQTWYLHKMNLPYGAVLEGTSEDNRLIGGAHDNVYRGLAGNDVLDGGLGDDYLDGGPGDDELIGGKGDDRLIPGLGTDTVDGGPGHDSVEYALAIDDVEILPNQVTFISTGNNSVNDEVKNTEYALFTDAATPLPTKEQSAIQSLNGVAGLWYDPVLDGEGYNVIITEAVTVILFYGYAADGERLWLISDTLAGAPIIGETTTLKMFVSTDGTFDEPLASSEVLKDWGQLEITFTACGTANANLSGDDGAKTSNLDKLAGIDHSTCP